MSAPPQPAQARPGARLWSLIHPPELPLFVPTEPTPCHGGTADPETWHDYRRPGPAIAACHTCGFIGRCGWNAIATGSAYGVWAGVQLPGGTNPQKLKAIREQLLAQFDQRRAIELGDTPIPPRPAITGAIAEVPEEAEATVITQWHAFDLDTKIRRQSATVASGITTLLGLMRQAAVGQIHKTLKRADGSEYRSIADYFNDAVRIHPVDASERKLMVEAMSGEGLSLRAIASALGVSYETIRRDLHQAAATTESTVTNVTVDRTDKSTTSINGKTYKRKPKGEPSQDLADTPTSRGQANALETARKNLVKAAALLEAVFCDLDNLDAGLTPDLIIEQFREIRSATGRIDKLARDIDTRVGGDHLSTSDDEQASEAVVIPMHRTVSAAISVFGGAL
jgi:WhiB family transcriptional regulator, redox-sensing transcriptional regulator